MEVDIIIKNGKIVTPSSIVEAGIAIDKGRFVAIAEEQNLPTAREVVNAKGNYILPGIIDEHVHTLDMGMAETNENFITGSMAAAAGGVTTVFEMPLCIPATTTLRAFQQKREVADKKFIVDFAFWGGAVPGNIDEIPKMVDAGAIGFKAMMAGSVPGVFEVLDDGMLLDAFRMIADCESVATVHAENEVILNHLMKKMKAESKKDIHAFFEACPVLEEVEAISRAAMLAEEARCRLHIVHVSCPQGVEIVYKRREEGREITCETGPHYLALSQEDGDRLGPYLKFAPPVRSKEETEKLWEQLAEGKIEALGSDHGPHPKENKEKGWADIWEAGNGAIALESFLPVLLSEGVNKGRISIQNLVSLVCENPAKLFGIYPQKGTIQVGSDADLVIVDMNKEGVIDAQKFHSLHKHSPFDGLEIKGMPVLTMVRGKVVAEEGNVTGEPGYGKFVRP
ncbi:MAG: allantoinase AllB [Deltaproteobacteria bacterium]|nr:allantoinase AllB [Deltaproteobacteria bacterium]MBW2045379.1 allantoinase AllB [Deltaproteobacteria bacterium]MBW2301778.1 allantoinase AllB [Deltaproteobacteria bacterium]